MANPDLHPIDGFGGDHRPGALQQGVAPGLGEFCLPTSRRVCSSSSAARWSTSRPTVGRRLRHRQSRRRRRVSSSYAFLPQWPARLSRVPGLSWVASLSTSVALASFMPITSTSAHYRRNFRMAVSTGPTPVRSHICEQPTSMRTASTASLNSSALRKFSADAKKT